MAWQAPASFSGGTTIELGTLDDLFIAAQVSISLPSVLGFDSEGAGRRVVILGTLAGATGGLMGPNDLANSQNWLQVGVTGRLQGFTNDGFQSSGNCRIENAGVISTFGNHAVRIFDLGTSGTGSVITNSGLIEGATGVRIEANDNATVTLQNTGTLRGTNWAYDDVSTEAHVDLIYNSGLVEGNVFLGLGDDLFDGRLGRIDGTIFGNDGSDRIYTGVGNQTIYGGVGTDTVMGGAGADLLDGGLDFDFASYVSATSGVAVNLATGGTGGDAAGDSFVEIEGIVGSAFNDTLTGSNLVNERLVGGAGNDTLNGGRGLDSLYGGAGRDTFVFNNSPSNSTNYDRLPDYVVAEDQFRLDDAAFAGIGPAGTLAAAAFVANTSGLAADASDRIIYDTTDGRLYFDANGSGAGGRVLMALLPASLAMTNSEFTIF